MADYYVQRASAGLIVSEGTQVSPEGKGYMDTPGIHSAEQVAGWRRVTDAVHAAGGLIAAQLWHVGRVSHESFHDGALPVSASAGPYRNRTTVRGEDGRPTRVACPVPRALDLAEIPRVVEDYRRATVNAREAGFDLVEIHGAHGYLLHQFLAADSNLRTDAYGGTLAQPGPADARGHRRRRRRLVVGPRGRSGSPRSARSTAPRTPRAPRPGCTSPASSAAATWPSCTSPSRTGPAARSSTTTTAARCARRTPDRSSAPGPTTSPRPTRLLEAGLVDAAAFGRAFIANPDLPRRLAEGLPLNPQRPESFYGGDAEGYTDYPAYGAA